MNIINCHPRERGDPAYKRPMGTQIFIQFVAAQLFNWIPAFARMTIAILLLTSPLHARDKISLIRDTEIEEGLMKDFCAPLLKAAQLNEKSFKLFLLQNKDINAFVMGGQNLFMHTGTLQKVGNPNELQGVIAHELGHIAGGHLSKLDEEFGRANRISMASVALGAALGILSRDFGVMATTAAGGMSMAERNLLSFSRAQESAADQFALNALKKAGTSSEGLLTMFKKLHGHHEALIHIHDPYLLTHPMTSERMRFVENAVQHSPFKGQACSGDLCLKLKRLVAKIDGFCEHPSKTLKKYPESDTSLPAQYARALAYHKRAEYPKANALMDRLIRDHPQDAYFHETKGQMLFEQGKSSAAEAAYDQAATLNPNATLTKIALAQAILAEPKPNLEKAQKLLDWAVVREADYSLGWALLAQCYGRKNNIGMAAYALAEQNFCEGALRDCQEQIMRAEKLVKANPPIQRKLQDMKFEVQRLMAKERRGIL